MLDIILRTMWTKPMTYQDLVNRLSKMSGDQLDCDVSVEIEDECFPGLEVRIADVDHFCLDENHPVLFIPL